MIECLLMLPLCCVETVLRLFMLDFHGIKHEVWDTWMDKWDEATS